MGYDTHLTPEQEAAFQNWARLVGRQGDTQDYDLRGAWLANIQANGNGHFPDTYKKPNHPTFSDESQYSTSDAPGGHWVDDGSGKYVFWASPANMQNMPIPRLQEYFDRVEPGNSVVFPLNYRLRSAPRKSK